MSVSSTRPSAAFGPTRILSTSPIRTLPLSHLHRPPFVRWSGRDCKCGASDDPDDSPLSGLLVEGASSQLIVAGAMGTLAVFLGRILHIDPFGNCHWDLNDVAIGALTAMPPIVLHFVTFLPEWPINPTSSFSFKNENGKLKLSIAETRKDRRPVDLLSEAMGFVKNKKLTRQILFRESLFKLSLFWLVGLLPNEMLGRAVGMTAAGRWFRDRLNEGNVLAGDKAGEWCAIVALIVVSVGVILGRAAERKVIKVTENEEWEDTDIEVKNLLEKDTSLRVDSSSVEKLFQSMSYVAKLSRAIDSVSFMTTQAALSMSFLITGNLISSITTGCLSFFARTVLAERHLRSKVVTTKEITPRKRVEMALQHINSASYQKIKANYVSKIEKAESTGTIDEAEDSEIRKKIDEWKEDKASANSEELSTMLDLDTLDFFFRSVRFDLVRRISSDQITLQEKKTLSTEKEELDSLIGRSAKVIEERTKTAKPLKLNFHRDIKDRYKGDKK